MQASYSSSAHAAKAQLISNMDCGWQALGCPGEAKDTHQALSKSLDDFKGFYKHASPVEYELWSSAAVGLLAELAKVGKKK